MGRTDLRVVKMTELYNAERYDRLHGALRANNVSTSHIPFQGSPES
jgi:hypothetical protein